jgi:hypothetical protein
MLKVAPLKLNGLTFSDSTTKANIVLNSQFSSVFTSEDLSNMPDMGVSSTPEIPPIIIHHNDVMKLLTSLNPHKATGPDSILARLLKETAKEITPALTFIFQASINQGKIPSDWKTAIVAPVFKNGDRGQPSNYMYRPISLTLICCKIMEYIMALMYTRKSKDPKTVPYGTPDVTRFVDDEFPSSTTVWVQSDKKS